MKIYRAARASDFLGVLGMVSPPRSKNRHLAFSGVVMGVSSNTLATAVICCVLNFIGASGRAEEAVDLEQKLLDNRLEIKSARLTVRYETTLSYHRVPPDGTQIPVGGIYDIFFRAPSDFRVDVVYDSVNKGNRVSSPPVKRVITDNEWISIMPREKAASIAIDSRKSAPRALVNSMIDPRVFGFCVTPIESWGNGGLEDVVFLSRRGTAGVTKQSEDGEAGTFTLIHGQYRLPAGDVQHRTWLSAAWNNTVRVREVEDKDVRQRVEVIKAKEVSGIWFPVEFRIQMYAKEGAGRLVYDQLISVENLQLNSPIKDSEFSLSGLGVEKGAQVASHGESMVWNGETLIPDPSIVAAKLGGSRFDPDGRAGILKTFLIGANVAVFVVLAYLIWRRGRQRAA